MLRIHHFCPHIGQPIPLGGFFHYFEHGGGKVRGEHASSWSHDQCCGRTLIPGAGSDVQHAKAGRMPDATGLRRVAGSISSSRFAALYCHALTVSGCSHALSKCYDSFISVLLASSTYDLGQKFVGVHRQNRGTENWTRENFRRRRTAPCCNSVSFATTSTHQCETYR